MYNLCYLDLSPSITDYQSINYKTINRILCKNGIRQDFGESWSNKGISLYTVSWHALTGFHWWKGWELAPFGGSSKVQCSKARWFPGLISRGNTKTRSWSGTLVWTHKAQSYFTEVWVPPYQLARPQSLFPLPAFSEHIHRPPASFLPAEKKIPNLHSP